MKIATPVSERKAGTLQGVILLLPVTMAVMGLIVLVPVLPQMMQQFHAVPGAQYLIPLVLTLPALCIAVLAPIAGAIVDAIGRRRTLIGALVIYAIAGVMPIFLSSLTAIITSRIVVGAMESAVVTASTTLIGDYFHGESRERWLANQTAVASISSIFFALLGWGARQSRVARAVRRLCGRPALRDRTDVLDMGAAQSRAAQCRSSPVRQLTFPGEQWRQLRCWRCLGASCSS